ncbi:MAG: ferrous iron transport protein A [Hyphomicrobiales bacterium]|nr:ferrous iron transport protein A [Hyphomicrobiales bacterium]
MLQRGTDNEAEDSQVNDGQGNDGRARDHQDQVVALGDGRRGLSGRVVSVGGAAGRDEPASAFTVELERRLLEMGFVEGARVEILHEGFIGRDPIAVQVDDMRVALRRKEANAVMVRLDPLADAGNSAGTAP